MRNGRADLGWQMTRRYESSDTLKQALEARARRAARDGGVDMGRFRQLLRALDPKAWAWSTTEI